MAENDKKYITVAEAQQLIGEGGIKEVQVDGTALEVSGDSVNIVSAEIRRVPVSGVSNPSTITIESGILYDLGTLSQALTVAFSGNPSGYANEYMLTFVAGSNCAVSLPNGVRYLDNTPPTYVAGRVYEIDVMNNLAVVGEFY